MCPFSTLNTLLERYASLSRHMNTIDVNREFIKHKTSKQHQLTSATTLRVQLFDRGGSPWGRRCDCDLGMPPFRTCSCSDYDGFWGRDLGHLLHEPAPSSAGTWMAPGRRLCSVITECISVILSKGQSQGQVTEGHEGHQSQKFFSGHSAHDL